jgi:hypothetical protein
MLLTTMTSLFIDDLRDQFGAAVQENARLASYTSARIGGPADILVAVK